jgi:hypothetical protein
MRSSSFLPAEVGVEVTMVTYVAPRTLVSSEASREA